MLKEKLKKISENVYEIPQEKGMLVPGRLFISDKMNIEEDALKQIANVAHLPGILNYSIGLADMHVGYGFPIGGVAAFDMDQGVISPGGVGYDINCLSRKSRILTSLGYTRRIEEFEKERDRLKILDKKNKKELNSSISLLMKKYSEKIIEIETESGIKIRATKDHPFYTERGMKQIREINEKEKILMYPFEGVEYKKPKKELLISEKDIDKLNRSETSKSQIKKKLKFLGLLPLYSDNKKIPYLIKIIGFILGDGSITLRNKGCQIGFYGNKEDLKDIKEDLKKIGFKSYFFSRERKHKIKTEYKEYEFYRREDALRSTSSSLTILLNLLGTPVGNKTKQDYNLPSWLMNSVKWYKRLLLASLFGAEMSSPKTLTGSKFNFYGLIFSLNKKKSLHGVNFINQISSILEEFEIRNLLLKTRKEKDSFRIKLMIYPDSKNLIKFFSKINYEYCMKKRKLANAAIIWLKQKEKVLEFREEILIKARKMRAQGLTKSDIIEKLSDKYVNKYFISKAIYYNDYAKTGTRIAYCFEGFNEFVEKNCFGEEGFVWDILDSKVEKEYKNLVYDFTVSNNNHNFISNGYVVSNCSIRLLKTNLEKKDIVKKQKEIADAFQRKIPSGVGRGSSFNLSKKELDKILENGSRYLVEKGYGIKDDYLYTEEEGCIKNADASKISERAKKRGIGQLGTIGAGNHFFEILFVDEIFDEEVAKVFGLKKDQVVIMIHCGSRGLGHQTASDYIKKMEKEYGSKNLPDRELINAPIKSELGKDYASAMAAAANFAFANKQLITFWAREELKRIFPESKVDVLYEVCHNIAKFEEYIINGKKKTLCVHRKGATRSFGAGRKEIPEKYREVGQPVLIPGSMGTSSYVLVGTKKSEELTFGSTVHGAGRVMSRAGAMKNISGEEIKKSLNKKGIEIKFGSLKSLTQESPEVYKDVDEVVNVVHNLGISKKVAKLKPLIVIIG